MGKGCRAPKLAAGLLFLVVGPNPVVFCVPNSGVSWASRGLDPAELDALSWQCSPRGFQGVIPDLYQSEWGRVAVSAGYSTPVIPLGIFFLPSLRVIVFWGLKSKGCEQALLLFGSELLPSH